MKSSVIDRTFAVETTASSRARRVRPAAPQPVLRPMRSQEPEAAVRPDLQAKVTKRRKVGAVIGFTLMNTVLFSAVYMMSLGASSLWASVRSEEARASALSAQRNTRTAVKSTEVTSRKLAALDSATEIQFGSSSLSSFPNSGMASPYVVARR